MSTKTLAALCWNVEVFFLLPYFEQSIAIHDLSETKTPKPIKASAYLCRKRIIWIWIYVFIIWYMYPYNQIRSWVHHNWTKSFLTCVIATIRSLTNDIYNIYAQATQYGLEALLCALGIAAEANSLFVFISPSYYYSVLIHHFGRNGVHSTRNFRRNSIRWISFVLTLCSVLKFDSAWKRDRLRNSSAIKCPNGRPRHWFKVKHFVCLHFWHFLRFGFASTRIQCPQIAKNTFFSHLKCIVRAPKYQAAHNSLNHFHATCYDRRNCITTFHFINLIRIIYGREQKKLCC